MKYADVLLEKAYFDQRPVLRVRNATVDIGVRSIVVEWQEGTRKYRNEGVRTGQGHFILEAGDGAGKATLHRFQNSSILEGFWTTSSRSGFWRLHLPEDTVANVVSIPKPLIASVAKRPRQSRRVRVAA